VSLKEHHRRMVARWADALNGTWRRKAACNPHTGVAPDPAAIPRFFTADDEEFELHEQREAALFCNTACPVQQECLDFAKDVGEEHGVWGGTTEVERRLLMKRARRHRRERRESA
jgi:WhiB family redox-sensing transcriptional regulator